MRTPWVKIVRILDRDDAPDAGFPAVWFIIRLEVSREFGPSIPSARNVTKRIDNIH